MIRIQRKGDTTLNYEDLAQTIKSAGNLKTQKRSGWVKKAGILNAESVADHSYRMALIGAILAEERSLDVGKVVSMCLLHDLAESKIGDLTPEEKTSEDSHRRLDRNVGETILSTLPTKSRKRLLECWKELFQKRTKEAKLTWNIDKLEMGFQMKDYLRSGAASKKVLNHFDPTAVLPKEMRKILKSY